MKITSTEEYGLRMLLRIARAGKEGMSIPQLSVAEGLSEPYTGKLTRLLRIAGFIQSTRGQKGGYVLAQSPDHIIIASVLHALDGRMYDEGFCGTHTGLHALCTHTLDCSVKSLWKTVQSTLDNLLEDITLEDMMHGIGKRSQSGEIPVSQTQL